MRGMLSTEPDAPPEPPALEPEAPRPTTPPKKLTAISRAARETRANVQVMAPMISTAEAAEFVAFVYAVACAGPAS
jgi:hypothetical protein